MEEIKVGEYIRTRGIIGKLARIEYDRIDTSLKWYVLDRGNHEVTYVNKPYIEKYSFNILDLIEVGDIVTHAEGITFITAFENEEVLEHFKKLYKNDVHLIKTILTKERYKANCYEV